MAFYTFAVTVSLYVEVEADNRDEADSLVQRALPTDGVIVDIDFVSMHEPGEE